MNSMNGDGCSSQCKKEPFFNCVGKSYITWVATVTIQPFSGLAFEEDTGNNREFMYLQCAFCSRFLTPDLAEQNTQLFYVYFSLLAAKHKTIERNKMKKNYRYTTILVFRYCVLSCFNYLLKDTIL